MKSGVMAVIVWAAWLAMGVYIPFAEDKLPIVLYIAGSVCYALWCRLLERSLSK